MVRKYKKKGNYKNWTDGQLQLAIQSVNEGKSFKAAAEEFGIPRSTLQKWIAKSSEENPDSSVKKGFSRIFNVNQEAALAKYISLMESKLMGLTSTDVRRLAFDLAEKLNVKHNFNRDKGVAGKDWLANFMNRHDLSIRKAEHTSEARAEAFNKQAVGEFFTLLEEVMNKHNFLPQNIYNVDETGVSVVPKTTPKIIARRGRKQVGGKTAAERGETVTAEMCMSAAGVFMPILLIFPRVKENKELLYDAPAGAWAEFHKSGYMQADIFVRWFEKFINFSRASAENPVLLLLDGHSTHVKNLRVIELVQENNVTILCFPPHCTHKMQPLDVGFMAPFNKCFGTEVVNCQRKGQRVTLKNLFSLVGKAFIQAAKMETAINAFRKCGIYPLDPSVYTDSDFAVKQTEAEANSSKSDLSSVESESNVQHYTEIIKDLTNSQKNSTEILPNNDSIHNQNSTAVEEAISNEVSEVRIPMSYIVQAKPLLNFLSSNLNLYSQGDSSLQASSLSTTNNNEQDFTGQLIDEIAMNRLQNVSTYADENILNIINGLAPEQISENTHLELNVKTEVLQHQSSKKRGNKKGKAAVITSDIYKENLIIEKEKAVKKPTMNKSKPRIKSETPTAIKRKLNSCNEASKKQKKVLHEQTSITNSCLPIAKGSVMPNIVVNEQISIANDSYNLPVAEEIVQLPVGDAILYDTSNSIINVDNLSTVIVLQDNDLNDYNFM